MSMRSAAVSDLSKIELGGNALRDLALAAGAGDAVHYRWRYPARLVYGDGVRLRRGVVFRGAVDVLLPGNRCEGALQGFARHRAPSRGRPVLRRYGQRLRLVAGVLQDSRGAAGQ